MIQGMIVRNKRDNVCKVLCTFLATQATIAVMVVTVVVVVY